ncbi:MAG: XisI protein [Bacteroidota bacterium]
MDKVSKYKTIVEEIVWATGRLGEQDDDDPIKTSFIIDRERGHFLLYFTGWKGHRRTYGCYLHIDVTAAGKVWLHHDGTDLLIGDQLEEKGVLASDLVLAFMSPTRRKDTGYAVF